MISVDLHTHTKCSHGKNSPREMFAEALRLGLETQGFSEHSPRPSGYDYPSEYREQLVRLFPSYVEEVLALKREYPGKVLLGIEMDWFDKELPFIEKAIRSYDFDYLIGSVHFIGDWGFDADPLVWKDAPHEWCVQHYEAYFASLTRMVESGLFNIAAHLDLVKIFSVEHFRRWLQEDGLQTVKRCLLALQKSEVSLELSSAGLRKPCREIYPGPEIMRLAAELDLCLSFGSDAHQIKELAFAFDQLSAYAASFGFTKGRCRINGAWRDLSL